MKIHGINKLTLLDYPEHTACTIFSGGCNFRCPFCQNSALILHPDQEPVLDMDWLFSFLRKRRNVLQGVCITGGEPTIQKDLSSFIRSIRELGYKIKLDTNGYHPEVVESLLQDALLDAVAMDIKSSPQGYPLAAGLKEEFFDFSRIDGSVKTLMDYEEKHPDFYYEFRTTLVKGIHREEDMEQI
ncbi:MAG: anaerobic ribonucleoside-triphosphate reductase activating protein, partial [Eubacterium sp.]|nr:anaerobic ribonucleoside-triphosphate reductase activating protein [Eubacterium sp.]